MRTAQRHKKSPSKRAERNTVAPQRRYNYDHLTMGKGRQKERYHQAISGKYYRKMINLTFPHYIYNIPDSRDVSIPIVQQPSSTA